MGQIETFIVTILVKKKNLGMEKKSDLVLKRESHQNDNYSNISQLLLQPCTLAFSKLSK